MQRDLPSVLVDFILQSFPEAVVILDAKGSVVESNRAARAHADIGRLFEHDGRDGLIETFLDDLRAHAMAGAEVRSLAGVLLRLEGVAIDGWLIVVARDISARKILDLEFEQLRSWASVSLLLATVVHDFNNVLTPVLLLSSRLKNELERDSRAAMIASEIHSAATLGAALMRDVLSLSKPGTSLIERVDVNEVVVERLDLIARLLGDSVEIAPLLDEDVGDVLVDRKSFALALLNLIANARDSMSSGGRVTITTRLLDDEGKRSVSLAVTDTGEGMTDEVRRHAFDSFFTTKGKTGGSGLGLASVHRFARESGGRVTLESEPLKGTTATVVLPGLAASEPPMASRVDGSPVNGSGGTVLVADRDERVRRAIEIALEARGYRVVLACSAESALQAAAAHRIDVALIDTQLTHHDHRTFLHRLRAAAGPARIVFLSLAPQVGCQADFEVAFLPKAFSDEELIQAVSEALGSLRVDAADRRGHGPVLAPTTSTG